ncbi:hypothetical protein [Actinoplanes missouriensis]|nr:hypothetical protein [Actinoplanes missouriensis]
MTPIDRLNRATELAPTPGTRDADRADWIRHYAAQAFAAHAAFRDQAGQGGADLGYLALIGDASLSAAVALSYAGGDQTTVLWDLSYDGGALNGEPTEWLVKVLDRLGINPADIDDRYRAGDFRTPSRAVA